MPYLVGATEYLVTFFAYFQDCSFTLLMILWLQHGNYCEYEDWEADEIVRDGAAQNVVVIVLMMHIEIYDKLLKL